MSAGTKLAVKSALGKAPYVGLRPFEPEERDQFCGRAQDAQILTDRILSGRLTVLYAQSGLGKSSLLRALVMPDLEENYGRVIYFDAWAQDDPLHGIKELLIARAASLGVPDPGRGSPTLVELVRLFSTVDDRSLILVLDQFEEFLVRHGQHLDPLRTELAALLRASRVDATVVLSLREEFLATLEPFRQHILNLFQTTHRLENLAEKELRDAICLPAQIFGGSCEPALADALIRDLRGQDSELTAGSLLTTVELPILQLVCQELWKQADNGQLTLALYERLGGVERMISDYVRALMPSRTKDQSFTARLLLHLAPPSGLKMSYAVQDLATITGLPADKITVELDRLSDARILRTRDYRAGVRYELEHDAFITVLQDWLNRALDRERRMRSIRRVALAACSVALVFGLVAFQFYSREQSAQRIASQTKSELEMALRLGQSEKESDRAKTLARESERSRQELENWQTGGLLDELRAMPEAERKGLAAGRFDMLTTYVLWKGKDPDRFEKLKRILMRNEDMIPTHYGVSVPTEEPPVTSAKWPLELQYSRLRQIDMGPFTMMWRDMAREIAQTWAIPVPMQVHFTQQDDLKADQIRLIAPGAPEQMLTVPTYEKQYLIRYTPEVLPASPAREFLQRFESDWKLFPEKAEWRLAPAWSLPVWKAAEQTGLQATLGRDVTNASGAVAFTVLQELIRQPGTFFSNAGVEALLRHAHKFYPVTVEEARAARGDKLNADLAARVKGQTDSLLALPRILSDLAERAESTNANVKNGVGANQSEPVSTAASFGKKTLPPLHGPWIKQNDTAKTVSTVSAGDDDNLRAFLDAEANLPEYRAIRVFVTADLVPGWFPKNDLSEELKERIKTVRQSLYRRYGFAMPGYRFAGLSFGEKMPASSIRVLVPGENSELVNRVWKIEGPDKLTSLMTALEATSERTRRLWIDTENTDYLVRRLPPHTGEWLQQHYSATDLKVLLRETVNDPRVPGGGTVRYPLWLISSLCFWDLVENPLDTERLRDRLTQTEHSRLVPRPMQARQALRDEIERGVNALVADDLATATAQFKAALDQGQQAAAQVFCEQWAKVAPRIWIRELERNYPQLDLKGLSEPEQWDLVDLTAMAAANRDTDAYRQLMVYQMASGLVGEGEQVKIVHGLLHDTPPPDGLSAEEARWLALRFFKQYDPLNPGTGDARQLAAATDLATSAVKRLEPEAALRMFEELDVAVAASAAPNWGWQLLEHLADARPGVPTNSLSLDLAWWLCDSERPDRLNRALTMISEYEKVLAAATVTDEERKREAEIINQIRANVLVGLARTGREELLKEAEQRLRRSLSASWGPITEAAEITLPLLLYEVRRFGDADAVVKAIKPSETIDASLSTIKLMGSFHQQRPDKVKEVLAAAEAALAKKDVKEADSWLYTASLAALLSGAPNALELSGKFLATEHVNRDYVLMIRYAFEGGAASPDAAQTLKDRWAKVDPATWPSRMKNGDATAWREMLIGRFVKAPQSDNLFNSLADEKSYQSSDLAGLPKSLRGLQCEAWFYEAMRAKAEGREDAMRDCLRKCAALGLTSYDERAMAIYLLAASSS